MKSINSDCTKCTLYTVKAIITKLTALERKEPAHNRMALYLSGYPRLDLRRERLVLAFVGLFAFLLQCERNKSNHLSQITNEIS